MQNRTQRPARNGSIDDDAQQSLAIRHSGLDTRAGEGMGDVFDLGSKQRPLVASMCSLVDGRTWLALGGWP